MKYGYTELQIYNIEKIYFWRRIVTFSKKSSKNVSAYNTSSNDVSLITTNTGSVVTAEF